MREALTVIAEVTDSQRLRQFLETGVDRKWFLGSRHPSVHLRLP